MCREDAERRLKPADFTAVPSDERKWLCPSVSHLTKLPEALPPIFRQTEAEPLWVGGLPPGKA